MIHTSRLTLIPCDDTIFDAIKMGDNVLATVLGCNVPKRWTENKTGLKLAHQEYLKRPEIPDWWTYLVIHTSQNLLIGTCGYKGAPNDKGEVEIGYEIKETHRNNGLGTEVALGLVENAFNSPAVTSVLAFTNSFENPSTSVLKKALFEKNEGISESIEGLVWKWEKNKSK